MNDQEFIAAFEECSLEDFHHADHVRLAFLYLKEASLLPAIERFVTNLRRYAASKGAPNLYHETITWAYLLIIHDRMQRENAPNEWEEFRQANQDLVSWKPSVLARYYTPETLASERARRAFVFPELGREQVIGSRE